MDGANVSSSSSLSAPLLQSSLDERPKTQNGAEKRNANEGSDPFDSSSCCCCWGRRDFLEEAKKQLWLSGPLVVVGLLTFSLHIISLMFVGHLGELRLSGASMATSFSYVAGFSLLLGMASTLETLCGQSYGAGQYHMLGVHTQRAMFILLLMCIPLSFIWANTARILTAVGQDHLIAAEAGTYAIFMIPGLFAYGPLQCIIRFLQTQNIVFPMMVSSAITTLLHIIVCWVLMFEFGLGSRGAALANSVSYWLNMSSLALYVKYSPSVSETWTGFSSAALSDIPAFLKLAIPSALMVCLEMWSFEMIVLLSGLLPNPTLETSVLSISLNTTSTVWVIPEGLSGAVSTRVSNELGAGRPRAARLAGTVVIWMTIAEAISVGLVMILIRNIWGYAYSNEAEVVSYLASMMPFLAITNLLDGLTCVLSGIARGCGWQKIGAFINLGSFYLVGIPTAILFGFFFNMGGRGLWLGFMGALFIQSGSLFAITVRTNWGHEGKKAAERIGEPKFSSKEVFRSLLERMHR